MRRVRRLPSLMLVASVVAGAGVRAWAATPEERFAEAQALFEAAQKQVAADNDDSIEARRLFHEAATGFAAIAADGTTSVNLCVNAGNAYHFVGDDPRALLWYLRAEKIANTPEVRAGLATLRRLCNAEQRPPERTSIGRVLMFWHYDLSSWAKQIFLLAIYPAACVLLLAGLMARRRALTRVAVVLILIGGVVGVSDAVITLSPPAPWAVVVAHSEGRSGDGPAYSVVAPSIVAGQEVRVLEARPQWVRVEMPSGLRCWLPSDDCEPV